MLDLEKGTIIKNCQIEINGRMIKNVGSESSAGKDSIDMHERFVMPGLINAHNNISMEIPASTWQDPDEPEAISVLRCYERALTGLLGGTTSLRLVGELNDVDLHLRNAINSGHLKGPNIVAAGRALGVSGGPQTPLGVDCDGEVEFAKAARRELGMGADFMKIFATNGLAEFEEKSMRPLMTKSEMSAVASAAESRGTYVTAHAVNSEAILRAVESGVTCIEHAYFLNQEAARAIKKVNGYLCPTLSVTRSTNWRRANRYTESAIMRLGAAAEAHMQSVRTALKERVPIVCGADLPPGDLNDGVNVTVREMEFLKEAGLSDLEVLRSATTRAAELCKLQSSTGLVKPGLMADLIATSGNPLDDVNELEKISFVVKSGEVIRDDLGHMSTL